MTNWLRLYAVLFALIAVIVAQEQQMPDCAASCLESSLAAQSECTSSNTSCICTNMALGNAIHACLSQSCSVKQILVSQNVTATMCDTPVRDNTRITNLLCGITLNLALIAVILRTVNALYIGAFGKDDACALIAGIFMVVDNAVTFPAGPLGYGLDIWRVPFDNITFILKLVFLMQVFYWPVSALTKLAFLFFYLRIFPGQKLRYCIFATMALTGCYWATFQFGNIFYCSPISQIWNGWDGEHDGKCLDINKFMTAATGTNILIDVLIIVLPIPELLKLSLSWRKKLGLLTMFTVGLFTLVVSVLRIQAILAYSKSQNGTYDNVPATYWSTVEINVGVFCVCMPAIRRILNTHFPRIFATTHGSRSPSAYYAAGTREPPRKKKTHDSLMIDTVIIRDAAGTAEDDEMQLVDRSMTGTRRGEV